MLTASLSRRGIYSSILSSVGIAPPVNTVLPVIDNTSPREGDTLNGSDGTWTGSPTFTYQWYLSGSPLGGATSNSYSVQAGDVGGTVTFKVIATNGGGSTTAESTATSAVIPLAPVNTVAPNLTSSGLLFAPLVSDSLICHEGTWSNTPTSFNYLWVYSDGSPVSGTPVPPYQYSIQFTDVGHAIKCTVTAINAGGNSTPIDSDTSGIVSL